MLMNRAETALINSPPRRWLQRLYEVPVLLRFGGRLPGQQSPRNRLRIGLRLAAGAAALRRRADRRPRSGPGNDRTGASPARPGDRVHLATGSATDLRAALDADDGSYDAVFDFGIIHHVPDWRAAVAEAARVLTPGGRFYFEEVTAHALNRLTYRRLFDHPTDDRFTAEDFLDEVSRQGLVILGSVTRIQGDYLLGVAAKPLAAAGGR